jgi:hypothetical protein
MAKSRAWLLLLVIICLVGSGCEETRSTQGIESKVTTIPTPSDPLPRGARILELDANAPEDENYDQVMELARELGAESIRLSVYWDDIERVPGVYDPDPNWLAIANQYYSAQGLAISLVISVLDTTEVRVPEDLAGVPFSDPEVIDRFQGLLTYIKSQLPDVELTSLAIGNEIDGVLGEDPVAWEEFNLFYQSSADFARGIWPDLPISTKVTFDGLFNQSAPFAREIYQGSDLVMTTYYPLMNDFAVRDPEVVVEDFQALTALFPNQEIHITEIGYPTSIDINSSEEKQARFIQYMFQAWDIHADQISVLSYSWLSDLPSDSVKELESYYGLRDKGFSEFLRTLGLRTYPGSGIDKIGFQVFRQEAESRGW